MEEFEKVILYFILGLGFKIIFDWLKYRVNGKTKNNPNGCLKAMANNIEWIRDVHDKQDQNGTPLWYVPRQWKRSLDIIDKRTMESNIHLNNILDELKEIRHVLEDK